MNWKNFVGRGRGLIGELSRHLPTGTDNGMKSHNQYSRCPAKTWGENLPGVCLEHYPISLQHFV